MNALKCFVLDDEPPAIRLMEKYIGKVDFLTHVGSSVHPLEALTAIDKLRANVVFLDIQMPELTGIQISKFLKGKTQIIFTTAYPQFALESYNLNAVDYLLKPISFERFYEAVLKLKPDTKEGKIEKMGNEFIFVQTDKKNNFERIQIRDILYVEGLKNYVAIHLIDRQIITNNTLKRIEKVLADSDLVKIHKSFIVSLQHVEKTDSFGVYINGKHLPIGDTYRQAFFDLIRGKKL